MRTRNNSPWPILLAFAVLVGSVAPVQAQLMDQLKGAVRGGQSGGGTGGMFGGMGGGLPAVGQSSASNTAGVLQYCVRNNYLSGGSAGSIKDSIVSKVTGSGQGSNDSGYKAGSSGLLQTGSGQSYSLGGSDGMKQQMTHKVCDLVLQHAKSLL